MWYCSFSLCPCVSVFLRHMDLYYMALDCPLHNNQELWHGWAPVLKSCLASGCQSPPGRLPPLPAVVERAIQPMEKSVFPISEWFALPCTPPHPTPPAPALRPGLHTAASGTTVEYHCTPLRLTNNNRATEGVMEKLPCWRVQASWSRSCQNKPSVWTHETDHKQKDKASDHSKCFWLINTQGPYESLWPSWYSVILSWSIHTSETLDPKAACVFAFDHLSCLCVSCVVCWCL